MTIEVGDKVTIIGGLMCGWGNKKLLNTIGVVLSKGRADYRIRTCEGGAWHFAPKDIRKLTELEKALYE